MKPKKEQLRDAPWEQTGGEISINKVAAKCRKRGAYDIFTTISIALGFAQPFMNSFSYTFLNDVMEAMNENHSS